MQAGHNCRREGNGSIRIALRREDASVAGRNLVNRVDDPGLAVAKMTPFPRVICANDRSPPGNSGF